MTAQYTKQTAESEPITGAKTSSTAEVRSTVSPPTQAVSAGIDQHSAVEVINGENTSAISDVTAAGIHIESVAREGTEATKKGSLPKKGLLVLKTIFAIRQTDIAQPLFSVAYRVVIIRSV